MGTWQELIQAIQKAFYRYRDGEGMMRARLTPAVRKTLVLATDMAKQYSEDDVA